MQNFIRLEIMGSRRLFLPLLLLLTILALHFIQTTGQGTNSSADSHSDDTVRVDPLDGFKKYRGGFDIKNKHYWSSTAFTGIYGYAIGVVWLLCGMVYGIFLVATIYCSRRNGKQKKAQVPHKYNPFWPTLIVTVFTILAITACGLVIGATARFYSESKTVVKIIMNTADEASQTIYNTTGAMKEMRDNLGATDGTAQASAFLTSTSQQADSASAFLTSTSQQLDSASANIAREARKNRRLINKGLKIVFIVTTVAIPITLIAIAALSVTGILRLRRALYWLIIICWLLTALCWIFFGIYYFLENFSEDTCTAFENFQENPYNNSLSSILPCDDLRTAQPILSDVSEGIYNLVNQVNANITALQATQNLNLAYVCNPFSGPPEYQYQSNNCPANTIPFGDIPKILSVFTCSDDNNGTCKEGEFIPYNDFKLVEAYTTSMQKLLSAYPSMESLVECQVVKDAFSEILGEHCKPVKRYVRMVWAAMATLSIIMVVLVLVWTVLARREQELKPADGSVKPDQYATASASEPVKVKAANAHSVEQSSV